MVRVLVGIHGNPSRSTSSSFLAVPGVYARQLCQPYEVILEWIKLYKVRRKLWGLSGSPAIVFDPLALCGVARTLCAGDVETSFLGGEAP
jgi:hypothetical protein